MKSYIWMGGIILVLITLMFWAVKSASPNSPKPTFDVGVISSSDNIEGKKDSKVVIVEYSDFQCPACRNYYLVMKELMVEFGDKVAFVYRYFPLTEIHANADIAARAAQAAGKQGKFWEMHNLLFEKQEEWANAKDPESLFESYVTLLGISIPQFKTDIASKEVADFVKSQRADAIKLKLQGTPSFFVNGKQIQNPASVDAFRVIINDALKSQ
ncbi:MAG: thioredoxin domain-containing protein [Patescibacteria group bacterium]